MLNFKLDKIVDEAFKKQPIEGLEFVGSSASRSLLAEFIEESSPISGNVFLANEQNALYLTIYESDTAITVGLTVEKTVSDKNKDNIVKAIEVLTEATRTYQSQTNNDLEISYSHSIEQWLGFESNSTIH
ncbi:hypothetical protein [Bacillus bombysepticus]|uniref:hypothetical protein n=1 Tax=Bacillus bombysepticus TaxID=658666 RepID=UPI003019966E